MNRTRTRSDSPSTGALSITRARQILCLLVKHPGRHPGGKVAIEVGGKVAAYLVTPEQIEELDARRATTSRRAAFRALRGSVRIVGDLEEASRGASSELERVALESWERQRGR